MNGKKSTHEGSHNNYSWLLRTWTIFLLDEATGNSIGPTIDVSKLSPGFILHFDFLFFNVDSIDWFNLTFVAIWSDTLYLFGFTSIIKLMPLDIIIFLFNALRNQDKKIHSIKCINIEHWKYLLNLWGHVITWKSLFKLQVRMNLHPMRKIDIPNKTLDNITSFLLLKLIHKK